MPFFEYGDKEIEYLKRKDIVLGQAIERIGHIERPVIPDLFEALINSIVGQQISTKALETVWKRMCKKLGKITPDNLAKKSENEIQECGVTMRKAQYIREAAIKIRDGELDINALVTLPDEEVCKILSGLKGIGAWTAEMLMIFSMQRPNIVSWNDLAIHRGMRMLYRHRKIDRKKFDRYRRRYAPYGSVASLYLWEVARGALGENCTDPGSKNKKNKAEKINENFR